MIWIRGDVGYIDGANLYAFCAANPINRVDPTGLKFDRVSAAAWAAAESYAILHNWTVSTLILHYFNQLSNDPRYGLTDWGEDLDLSNTAAASKIGRHESQAIQKEIADWVIAALTASPKSIPRKKIEGSYLAVFQKDDDPDLYWGVHGAKISWNAEIEVGAPFKKPDGSGCTASYKLYNVEATLEDDFDFNPDQFKSFPAKQLNDWGGAQGVPFHIFCELTGFSWKTDNIVIIPNPTTQPSTTQPATTQTAQ
jgi:hypothetical protein